MWYDGWFINFLDDDRFYEMCSIFDLKVKEFFVWVKEIEWNGVDIIIEI